MNRTMATRSARLAGILGHRLRVEILSMLARQPRIVGDLVAATHAEQALVSKQLGILRAARLLRCNPDGRCLVYAVADGARAKATLSAFDALARSETTRIMRCARAGAHARGAT